MIAQIIFALIFNLIDLVTGFIGAFKTKTLESSKMRDGMFKKVGFIFCYLVAAIVDEYGHVVNINIGVKALPIVIGYAVITEIISIFENIHVINPDILPEKLLSIFRIGTEEGKRQ